MSPTAKPDARPTVGVFLCQCGPKIAPHLDLPALRKKVAGLDGVDRVEIMPFPCEAPGLAAIKNLVSQRGLDRVLIAGCEARVMAKKFETALADVGLEEGQVAMVNLRDHLVRVNDGLPEEMVAKGAKMINAAVAGLAALQSAPRDKVEMNGPVMILGGGIATYPAAQELIRRGIDTIIAVPTEETEDEIRMMHERYPGERQYHDRLRHILDEVDASPLVRRITVGELEKVLGRVGDYAVTFSSENGKPPRVYQAGAIIAALDGVMLNQGSEFGHDGKKVLCQTEMEEYIWLHGPPLHRVIFWINDFEAELPYAYLSARTAWNMAEYIKSKAVQAQITVLYNDRLKLPLSATERARARALGVDWIPYDGDVRPTVQSGYITFTRPEEQIEVELPWDQLVLSPRRSPGHDSLKVAEVLGMHVVEGKFLERNPQMVRPEMVGQDEKFLAGSARTPCDLREALRQGRRAAAKTAEIVAKALAGELYAPRMVCTVDQTKCIGCGLCREICDCGGIMPVDGPGGNVPRTVDPMVCTGGGTCAAACPYHALTIQTNTTSMAEARVSALARSLDEGEIMGFGCRWGGGAAADHAGLRGLKTDPRFYLLPVACIGQLDATVFGRALLEGAPGLLLVGCPPEECHHSYGLDHAWSRVNLVKKLLELCGLDRGRIALAHCDLNDPEQYVRTVQAFVAEMDRLGPLPDDEATREKIRALYATLANSRVRWVLGASLRRPWEETYPADQRNARAYDDTLLGVLTEEFVRARITNLIQAQEQAFNLEEITDALGLAKQNVLHSLRDLVGEGLVSRIFKDRQPYYTMQ